MKSRGWAKGLQRSTAEVYLIKWHECMCRGRKTSFGGLCSIQVFFNSPCLKVHQSFTKDSSTRTVSVHKSALNWAGISRHVKSILWISSWFTRACILIRCLPSHSSFPLIHFLIHQLQTREFKDWWKCFSLWGTLTLTSLISDCTSRDTTPTLR